jgi:hypothetical protein
MANRTASTSSVSETTVLLAVGVTVGTDAAS